VSRSDANASRLALVAWVTFSALTGCAQVATPPAERPPPPTLHEEVYQAAQARGESVFRLVPERSLITIRVYRGGALAKFGHDHVIAGRDVHGFVLLAREMSSSRADLYVPLDTLSVDEPALRAEAGLDTTPSASDIAGTKNNMLTKVLQADRYAYVRLQIGQIGGELPEVKLGAELTLHGMTRALGLPAKVTHEGNTLRVRGEFSLRQTDFGMTPYAILGGALRVEDRIDLRYDLVGEPFSPSTRP